MARLFRRERGGSVVARLEPYEVALLRGLIGDVVTLVREEPAQHAAYQRLFPSPAHDERIADDLRDLIHDDLREAKLAVARTMLDSLPDDGDVTLDPETADAWLTALNDVRLAVGTSIGVTEDDADNESDDPGHEVYRWLSWLQESLVEAVSDR